MYYLSFYVDRSGDPDQQALSIITQFSGSHSFKVLGPTLAQSQIFLETQQEQSRNFIFKSFQISKVEQAGPYYNHFYLSFVFQSFQVSTSETHKILTQVPEGYSSEKKDQLQSLVKVTRAEKLIVSEIARPAGKVHLLPFPSSHLHQYSTSFLQSLLILVS